jgi:hypothetical protein
LIEGLLFTLPGKNVVSRNSYNNSKENLPDPHSYLKCLLRNKEIANFCVKIRKKKLFPKLEFLPKII